MFLAGGASLAVAGLRLPGSSLPQAGVPAGPQLVFERSFAADETTATQPNGILVSGGKVYVADPVRGRIDVYTQDGSRVATIGAGVLQVPVYVAMGPIDGRLYVSDRDLGTIVVFAADGKRFGYVDPNGLRRKKRKPAPWRPLGLAFASNGTLYVADSSDDAHIAVFSPAGSRIATLGADVPPGRIGRPLAFPNGMVVTDAELIVADSNNGRLVYFGLDGSYRRAVTVNGIPRGIAQLPDGGLILSDAATGQLRAYGRDGAVRAKLAPSTGDAPIRTPAGVAVQGDGTIFVADAGSGSIAVVRERPGTPAKQTVRRTMRPWLLLGAALCLLLAISSVIFGIFHARKRPREHQSSYNRAQVRVGKRLG